MAIGTITHGPPIFPRSVNGRIPDEHADARLLELRQLVRDRDERDRVEAQARKEARDGTVLR